MLPSYFVICIGDLAKDPIKHCDDFLTIDGALAFIKVWENKGYDCQLFKGHQIPIKDAIPIK